MGERHDLAHIIHSTNGPSGHPLYLSRLLCTCSTEIDAIGLVAEHGQESDAELADEPQAKNANSLTRGQVQTSDALQSDTPKRSKGSFFKRDASRNRHSKIAWHDYIFGMVGKACAHTGYIGANGKRHLVMIDFDDLP